MRVSVITATYNAASCLKDCIESVRDQSYPEVEHIIIDGGSIDGTQEVVASYGDAIAKFVSEPDKGLYDAMNKGIKLATGDIVGLLNADDFLAHKNVLAKVVAAFEANQVDMTYGDLVYVKPEALDEVVRFYPGKDFEPRKMRQGNMPPHPTVYARREVFEKYGDFDLTYRIASDFDWLVRMFVVHALRYTYIPEVLVHMRTGGTSTRNLQSNLTINREMLQSCQKHGIQTSLPRIYSKYFTKIFQLINRPA